MFLVFIDHAWWYEKLLYWYRVSGQQLHIFVSPCTRMAICGGSFSKEQPKLAPFIIDHDGMNIQYHVWYMLPTLIYVLLVQCIPFDEKPPFNGHTHQLISKSFIWNIKVGHDKQYK